MIIAYQLCARRRATARWTLSQRRRGRLGGPGGGGGNRAVAVARARAMKVKRDKSVRRRMTMYSHVFGFREPYRVLCDGNFLQVDRHMTNHCNYWLTCNLVSKQAALDVKMFLKDALPKCLLGPCNPMVSNCIRGELRKIGDAVSGASLIAKRFTCIRCACQVSSR